MPVTTKLEVQQHSPYGNFSILPKEIREMIYGPAFADGSVALRRVSKAFYEDTKGAIEHHGVYRVNIEYNDISPRLNNRINFGYHWQTEIHKPFPCDSIAKVQNLKISISREPDSSFGTYEVTSRSIIGKDFTSVLAPLAKSAISCRNCNIELKDRLLIAQSGFEESAIDNKEFIDRLRTMTVEWRDEAWTWQPLSVDRNFVSNEMELFLGFKKGCFVEDPRFTLIQHPATTIS